MRYRVFKRTWWRDNPDWPDGLEPEMGTKQHVRYFPTEEEALEEAAKRIAGHETNHITINRIETHMEVIR